MGESLSFLKLSVKEELGSEQLVLGTGTLEMGEFVFVKQTLVQSLLGSLEHSCLKVLQERSLVTLELSRKQLNYLIEFLPEVERHLTQGIGRVRALKN